MQDIKKIRTPDGREYGLRKKQPEIGMTFEDEKGSDIAYAWPASIASGNLDSFMEAINGDCELERYKGNIEGDTLVLDEDGGLDVVVANSKKGAENIHNIERLVNKPGSDMNYSKKPVLSFLF